MKKTKRAGLGSIHAAGKIKMASRLANRLKSLSPYVDEKVFRNLQKRLENIPLSERRSQKIQASKGRFFVICLLNSTAHRGPLMLGERPRLLAENASKRFYRSSGQWVRISIQWAWSRIQILCSANWLGLLMFFMFLGVDYLLKATCNKRSRDHPSFKQWVGILLMLKIDRAQIILHPRGNAIFFNKVVWFVLATMLEGILLPSNMAGKTTLGHHTLRESRPVLQESRSARRESCSAQRDSRLARGW